MCHNIPVSDYVPTRACLFIQAVDLMQYVQNWGSTTRYTKIVVPNEGTWNEIYFKVDYAVSRFILCFDLV